MTRKLSSLFALLVVGSLSAAAFGQGSYKQPPKEVLDVLNAPAPPATSIAPSRDRIALLDVVRYPPVAELAEPMLRLPVWDKPADECPAPPELFLGR